MLDILVSDNLSDTNLSYPNNIYQDILCCFSSAAFCLHFSLLYLSSFDPNFLSYVLTVEKSRSRNSLY